MSGKLLGPTIAIISEAGLRTTTDGHHPLSLLSLLDFLQSQTAHPLLQLVLSEVIQISIPKSSDPLVTMHCQTVKTTLDCFLSELGKEYQETPQWITWLPQVFSPAPTV